MFNMQLEMAIIYVIFKKYLIYVIFEKYLIYVLLKNI